jgi:hypothetical protein
MVRCGPNIHMGSVGLAISLVLLGVLGLRLASTHVVRVLDGPEDLHSRLWNLLIGSVLYHLTLHVSRVELRLVRLTCRRLKDLLS